jgi:uncharacterized membrane protein
MSGIYDDPRRRAELDLLFLDIEHRIEQIRASHAQVSQLAADADLKRLDLRMSDRRFLVALIGAAAALLAAGAGLFAAGAVLWKQPVPIVIHVERP